MPRSPDTIRLLLSTDNHVGHVERDAVRGEDSWRSFHEIMCLAKDRDVDAVILAGDLFHDNKPSRKSMFNVMRSLRLNCLGDKPCELEMLSDSSEVFQGTFDHVNYEDPDINVAIPVFSIHGNHDDPSGEGHLAALDILQTAGLINYYGRTPESDNIQIKPVLLRKGRTKLALYGMSNVRDERLFRTFRDGKVKFFRPDTDKQSWFNLMSVHQNRHAYTETGYLPENFLPDFMNLVLWGHEHECLIDPEYNAETKFHVIQPGSSVATSLVPGESGPKFVALLEISSKDFQVEKIRLKTVRPFVMREIVLAREKDCIRLAKKPNNQTDLTRFLEGIVNEMINEALQEWEEAQGAGERDADEQPPLPLIRLRVDYTAPEGGNFQCENPQRFSNRFVGKVANVNDVVQFHRKKSTIKRVNSVNIELPDASSFANQEDSVKVERLVKEFLSAQALTIFPQNSFGDAVSQFVDKDDKHAMEAFVLDSLKKQVEQLIAMDTADEDGLAEAMERAKAKMEELFAQGHMVDYGASKRKEKPSDWDSDMDGHWHDQVQATIQSDEGESEVDTPPARAKSAIRGRGGRGGRRAAVAPARKPAAKKPVSRPPRTKKAPIVESDVEEASDTGIVEDSNEEELFIAATAPQTQHSAASRSRGSMQAATPLATASTVGRRTTKRGTASSLSAAATRQSQLTFSQIEPGNSSKKYHETISSDDDDDDAFEPVAKSSLRSSRR